MNYAVDKELILQQLHAGLGTVSPGQLSAPGMFGYNPNLAPYPYDLDRAKSLLAEAGAEGLEVDYVGPKGRYAGDAILNQAIAEMLEQAGLKVNLNLLDPQSWVRFGDRNQTPVPPSCWYLVHSNSASSTRIGPFLVTIRMRVRTRPSTMTKFVPCLKRRA